MTIVIALLFALVTAGPAHAAYPPSLPPDAVLAEVSADGALVGLSNWRPFSTVDVRWNRTGNGGRGASAGLLSGVLSVKVDEDGAGTVLLPLTIPGEYAVTANGINKEGERATVAMMVEVPCGACPQVSPTPTVAPSPEEEPRELAATGFALGWLIAAALSLILLGLLLSRSRKDEAEASDDQR